MKKGHWSVAQQKGGDSNEEDGRTNEKNVDGMGNEKKDQGKLKLNYVN